MKIQNSDYMYPTLSLPLNKNGHYPNIISKYRNICLTTYLYIIKHLYKNIIFFIYNIQYDTFIINIFI